MKLAIATVGRFTVEDGRAGIEIEFAVLDFETLALLLDEAYAGKHPEQVVDDLRARCEDELDLEDEEPASSGDGFLEGGVCGGKGLINSSCTLPAGHGGETHHDATTDASWTFRGFPRGVAS